MTSVIEIKPPVDEHGRYTSFDAPIVWEYRADAPEPFYSSEISGAHRLPNGNTLICAGCVGNFLEVTAAGEIVWRYANSVVREGILSADGEPGTDHRGHQWNAVFKIHRYAPDYAGLAGKSLTPGGVIEQPLGAPMLASGDRSERKFGPGRNPGGGQGRGRGDGQGGQGRGPGGAGLGGQGPRPDVVAVRWSRHRTTRWSSRFSVSLKARESVHSNRPSLPTSPPCSKHNTLHCDNLPPAGSDAALSQCLPHPSLEFATAQFDVLDQTHDHPQIRADPPACLPIPEGDWCDIACHRSQFRIAWRYPNSAARMRDICVWALRDLTLTYRELA